jgi:hypothetical protein
MSKTKSEVVTKVKDNVPPKSRTEIIDLLINETNGKNSELGDSHILMYGGTEDTLRKQIESIIRNNKNNHSEFKKFKTVEEFVDHAIRMQLIWWGKTPEIFNKELNQLVVTPTQKDFMEKFIKEQHKQFEDELLLDVKIGETFNELQTNIKKCYNQELEFDKTDRKKNLMYDTYPVLWKYYSRLLPIKATLHIINYIAGKNEKPYFEVTDKNLDLAFQLLTNVGNILTEYDNAISLKRNQKIGTGFPSQIENEDVKSKITKMQSVKNRFKSHLIGKKSSTSVFDRIKEHAQDNEPNTKQEKYEKFVKENLDFFIDKSPGWGDLKHHDDRISKISVSKQNWKNMEAVFSDSVKITKNKIDNYKGSYQGALNALDLVIPFYDEETKITRLYISSKGHEFLKIKNLVLESLKLIEEGTLDVKNASKNEKTKKILDWSQFAENSFSGEEVEFILNELIPTKLSLEYDIISSVISKLNDGSKLSAEDVEQLIASSCLSWGYENPEGYVTHKINQHIAGYFGYLEPLKNDGKIIYPSMPEDVYLGKEDNRTKWQTKRKEEIVSWRMATMGRLSEMGVIDWQMKEGGTAEYSKGKNFDAINHLTVRTRKQIIAGRKDYQDILKQYKN